jgi:hypothetical protein
MWFPTKQKIEREIDILLSRFERIAERAQINIDESNKFASTLGPNDVAETIHKNSLQIIGNLYEAATQARFGMRPLRAIATDLSGVDDVASKYAGLIDNMDLIRRAGEQY